MVIKLYENTSDNLKLNKTLTGEIAATCNIHEIKDDTHISFILDYSTENYKKNYCYVEDLQRFYFIDSREISTGKRLIIKCVTDLYGTFKNEILTATATATRSNFRNDMLHDNLIVQTANTHTQYRKLGTALSGESYIISLGG